DAAGQVAYEVDQEGYVTGYTYNGFGQQASLRRYARPIAVGAMAGWSEGQPITLEQIQAAGVVTTSSTDRIVATTWDTRGNKLKVTQAGITYLTAAGTLETGAPTKTFEYDGFGQLVKESVLLDASTSTWADTLHFHDAMGREIRTIDAEGFVTD